MTIWFTADHHFGHANIIRFCHRPFANVIEMDEAMVHRWNSAVSDDDEVWHLGGFGYRCGPNRLAEIFDQLRGRTKHLIRGNHDRQGTLGLPWTSVQYYAEITVDGQTLVLFHYALRVWNRCRLGSISLHGHGHAGCPMLAKLATSVWMHGNSNPYRCMRSVRTSRTSTTHLAEAGLPFRPRPDPTGDQVQKSRNGRGRRSTIATAAPSRTDQHPFLEARIELNSPSRVGLHRPSAAGVSWVGRPEGADGHVLRPPRTGQRCQRWPMS